MPLVRPVIVAEVSEVRTLWIPGEETTKYCVMGLPPLDAGGFQLTTAWSLLVAAVTFKGAPGTVEGIPASDGEDGEPVPAALVAVTVKE